jgi:hypothetical protein
MNMSRRKLLTGVAVGAVAASVAACSTTQIASFESAWASIVDEVQSAVAAAAQYIPTVESIAQTAASLFGPAWQAAVAAGTVVVNQIITTLTSVVNSLTPPAVTSLRAKLRASSVAAPVVIGTTTGGVVVHGYKV